MAPQRLLRPPVPQSLDFMPLPRRMLLRAMAADLLLAETSLLRVVVFNLGRKVLRSHLRRVVAQSLPLMPLPLQKNQRHRQHHRHYLEVRLPATRTLRHERRSTSEKRRSSLHRCRVKSLRLACGSIRPDRRHPFQPRRRLPRNWNRPSRNGKKTNFRFLPPSSLQGQLRWETRCRRKLIRLS